jgi:hypothetical protein
LVGREARRKLKEALAHVLGAEASPEDALTIDKHRLSYLTVAKFRCRSPLIKVSINTFPSNSGEPPRSASLCHREREPAPPRPELAASTIGSVMNDRDYKP